MSSLQSGVAATVAKLIRNSFFMHKAETATQRKSFERLSNFTKFPRFVKSKKADIEGIDGTCFYPKRINEDRVVLYIHGGGFGVGSVKTHKALIARVARAAKCMAIGINYRLAPEHPYPAAIDDCFVAYKALVEKGFKNIFLVGDSAGGGLCLSLMLRLREAKLQMPIGAALISPWTDLSMSGESIRTKEHVDPLLNPTVLHTLGKKYLGDQDPKLPYISPLFGDLNNLPPVLIQVGGNEILVDDSTRLAKKLKKAGGEVELEIWDNMFHVWHYLAGILPESQSAIRKIGQFIRDTHKAGSKLNNGIPTDIHLEVA